MSNSTQRSTGEMLAAVRNAASIVRCTKVACIGAAVTGFLHAGAIFERLVGDCPDGETPGGAFVPFCALRLNARSSYSTTRASASISTSHSGRIKHTNFHERRCGANFREHLAVSPRGLFPAADVRQHNSRADDLRQVRSRITQRRSDDFYTAFRLTVDIVKCAHSSRRH